MAANKLVIANMALQKMGARPITSFTQEGSQEAVAINAVYDEILKEVLSEHPWTFAQKRLALTAVVPDDVTRTINQRIYAPASITAATADEPVVITSADHGLANGDRIKIVGVSGMTQLNDNFYVITNATRTTFAIVNQDTGVDIDGDAYTAYTAGGQIYLANDTTPILITAATAADPVVITSVAHGFIDGEWVYIQGVLGMTQLNGNFYIVDDATANTFSLDTTAAVNVNGLAYGVYTSGGQILEAEKLATTDSGAVVVYQKPADFIKPIAQSNSYGGLLQIEDDKIIADSKDLKLRYTALVTDTTKYFPKFTQALSTRLAAEIASAITNSTTKSEQLMRMYLDVVLPSAVSVDSTQGTPDQPIQDQWETEMMTGEKYVTNPQTWHPL